MYVLRTNMFLYYSLSNFNKLWTEPWFCTNLHSTLCASVHVQLNNFASNLLITNMLTFFIAKLSWGACFLYKINYSSSWSLVTSSPSRHRLLWHWERDAVHHLVLQEDSGDGIMNCWLRLTKEIMRYGVIKDGGAFTLSDPLQPSALQGLTTFRPGTELYQAA